MKLNILECVKMRVVHEWSWVDCQATGVCCIMRRQVINAYVFVTRNSESNLHERQYTNRL
jgi:hypothetical protein